MNLRLKILYTNLGGTYTYVYDKQIGRILNWAKLNNEVFIVAPQIDYKTIKKELLNKEKKIKAIFLPLTKKETNSTLGIISAYLLRILISPTILFKKMPVFDFAFSNSCLLVDVIPILYLKLFGKCRHWILMMDSVVPSPKEKKGNLMIKFLTYLESIIIGKIANVSADLIFTVNPELQKKIIKRGIKKEKIYLSQNGLFMEKINLVKNRGVRQFDAAYMGRISPNKGVFDLIKVWKNLVKEKPEAKLIIMGTGLDYVVAKFKQEIQKQHLQKNIEYLGFTPAPKKYEILKNAKVFLYLSKVNADESWGISLMEALACGVSAISYNLPIYKHIYKTESLIKVRVNDVDAVLENLLYLLNNQRERENLSQKAVSFAQNFDWFKIARQDLKIIKDEIRSSEVKKDG